MTGTARIGYWSAIGACGASLAYVGAQLLQIAGMLPDPIDRILIFSPSLILAPLCVLTFAAAYGTAASKTRGWRLAALALSLLYAGMASIVYINQLGVVIPDELHGIAEEASAWACCTFQEPMTAIDLLGYTYLSLALLLLAPSYPNGALRWLLIADGLLAPLILFQLYWPMLILGAAAWLGLFPATMGLLARDFARPVPHHRSPPAQRPA